MEGWKLSLVFSVFICYVVSRSQTAGVNSCAPDMPCNNFQCIKRDQWCDGYVDCDDESDEKYCKTKKWYLSEIPDNKCDGRRHFLCSNLKCVPIEVKCDEFNDCGDYSEEEHCDELNKDSKSDSFASNRDDFNGHDISQNGNFGDSCEDCTETPVIYSTSATPRINAHQRPGALSIDHYNVRLQEVDNPHPDRASPAQNDDNRRPQNPGVYKVAAHEYPYSTPSPLTYRKFDWGIPVFSTTPWDAPVVTRRHSIRQQWPEIHRQRAIIYGQTQNPGSSSVSSDRKEIRTDPLPPFDFEDDFESFRNSYRRKIKEAAEWLLELRDSSYRWGRDTPRALVALSLINNSFPSNVAGNDVMKRRFKLDLGIKLLRRNVEPLSANRLAMHINALMATCQDPRRTFNVDLVEMLYNRVQESTRSLPLPNPFVFITLCLANGTVTRQDSDYLKSFVSAAITDEVSKDNFILATTALACLQKSGTYDLTRVLETAARKLREQQLDDGSYGSIYSTALAAQAFIAMESQTWNPRLTLNFLSDNQSSDGSFGNMLATYYILPALSGRSLVHLRNTQCERQDIATTPAPSDDWNLPGPKKSVLYSLATGYEQRLSIALQMTAPLEASFFEIMLKAQELDSRFKFLYVEVLGKIDVHTISNIPNNPERGMYWNLYVLDKRNQTVDTSQMYHGDIRSLVPEDSQELLFWYLPFNPVFFEGGI